MILLSPWWCLLILFALLPWIGPWRGSNLVQNVLRSLLFVFLGLALAQPRLTVDNQHIDRVLIVDRSSSVTADAKDTIAKQLSQFSKSSGNNVSDHLVMIGDPLDGLDTSQFKSSSHVSTETSQGSSPLSAAITRAQSIIPNKGAGSLTIASDSLATRPDDGRAIAALRSRKIPIHWVDLPTTERPPTPVQVRWPAPMRQGASARLIVKVVSDAAASGEVSLKQGDVTLASTQFNNLNQQQLVELTFEPKEAGFLNGEILVSSGDASQSLPVVLPIEQPYQLLYLGDLQNNGSLKLAEMLDASFEVATGDVNDLAALGQMLQKADLVMLDDMPAESLPKEAEQQLVSAVQNDGLGIVMSGGRASFGAGGWHSRPIESLLPIELVQKQEKRDPSTSLVIVIDTSGSMSGVRVQLAKEVSRLAMQRLLPHDKVGIVEFFGAKRWAAPLQPASNTIELQRALNRMDAGGGTVILPALEEAFYGLQNVDTRYKHVLVLTDGGVEAGDFESLIRRMAAEGINVSTVLAGGGYHSEFLVNIANWGKGRFYNVPNRFNLPEILLKQPSTSKLPAYRPGSHTVRARGGEGWWGDVDMSAPPNLAGYVESKPRPGSQVLLETVSEKHPILATWRYGLGRVTTLATEPLGNGTESWQEWADYSKALARILERSAADARDPFQFTTENDGGKVIVHAIRQQSRNQKNVPSMPVAKVVDSTETLSFIRRSPERFVAFLPAPPKGKVMRINTSSSTTPLRQHPLVVASPTVEEKLVDPQACIDLGKLADVSGGQRFNLSSNWSDAPTSAPTGKTLWSPTSWLFGLSLLLFLAEIVWRRRPAPSTSRIALASVFLFVCLATGQQSFAQNEVAQPTAMQTGDSASAITANLSDAQINLVINELMQTGVDRTKVDELFRSATLTDGDSQKLLQWLSDSRGDINQQRGQVIAEVEAHVASQSGDLKRAATVLTDLLEVEALREQRTDLLIWHAKLYDATGDTKKARELYEDLANQKLSDKQQQTVRLRLALIGLTGTKKSSGAKPLIEMAQKSEDLAFRNRAAIVLALQNQPREAVKLFTIQGVGTIRFRNASRVTEWAIRAKDRDQAIKTAWDAVNSAKLKRDRNYALSLLVESYRLKNGTEGLKELLKKLAEKNDAQEAMADEVRLVWIGLLRELGRYDDAIALFKSTADGESGFSVEMRRELLNLEGEAGNEERMLQSYRELIKSEPKQMIWRSGLTQILLEKGRDADARALWADFVNESTSGTILLTAAQTLGEYGMDDIAETTIERMVQLKANQGQALLYWADLQQRRGNFDLAEQTLNRIHAMDDAPDGILAELASAFERIGRQDKAIEVNEAIREGRDTVAEDLELRLAWLYSEVGDEEKAQEQWLALWRKSRSIPRRRYIEDRLMTVASRLGTLADIAIELEEKLDDGTADAREAGLLVRIYSRVNDSVAATEISEEYMANSGKNEVEQLQEKGRIYQICNDYWNYEKVIEQLIEVDPAGKTEYLRQLALSMLERGKAQEAREVLMTLRNADDGKDSVGGEFEAGVLSLVGMQAEAASAYRKGIATHPDRIESYLLLANLLKDMGQTDRAVGIFQHLAENAQHDDLFTIAIDGLLNMEAKANIRQWAQRVTLERLAGREDKNYLYQLLSDLSAEARDKSMQIRALENSLAVSGTRRLSVLRECMELSTKVRASRAGSFSTRSTRSSGPTNKGNAPFFAFGRRLIGTGELLPPQVFLDLGQAFLQDGDTISAKRTFSMAHNLTDTRGYQREVAKIFENAGELSEALLRYDKLLRTSPSDVALIWRVAKLNEQLGQNEVAFRFYQRGLNLLFSQNPLTTQEEKEKGYNRNRDSFTQYKNFLRHGLVITLPDDEIDNLLNSQTQLLAEDLKELGRVREQGRAVKKLADSPRIDRRADTLRDLFFALERVEGLESLNAELIEHFPDDKSLVTNFANELAGWGRYDSIDRMLQAPNLDEGQRSKLRVILGKEKSKSGTTSKLSSAELWQRLSVALIDGDNDAVKSMLRRVDPNKGRTKPGTSLVTRKSVSDSVTPWVRLALVTGDEGLALQFARSQLKKLPAAKKLQVFAQYERILPEKQFADFVRYAANIYKDKPANLTDYLWLLSNYSDQLGGIVLEGKDLLEQIKSANPGKRQQVGLSRTISLSPESIRVEVVETILKEIPRNNRLSELVTIPFDLTQPIDERSAKAILEAIESRIDPAIQSNTLRVLQQPLSRSVLALKCPENAPFAMSVLDVLMNDKVRKSQATVSRIAEYAKAVLLHRSGKTDAGIDLLLQSLSGKAMTANRYIRSMREWALSELVPQDPDRFVDPIEKKIKGGKPTVAQTDQILKYIKQSKDENALRNAYHRALKDHPKQTKYAIEYETWEQGQKRPFAIIDQYEKRLADAQAAKDLPTTEWTQNALTNLLIQVDHLPKAMPHWSPKDDIDRKRFATLVERRAKDLKAENDKKPDTNKLGKTYPATTVGVKRAIDAEDFDGAKQTIHNLWRTLPSVAATRSRIPPRPPRLNGLRWPAQTSAANKEGNAGVNKEESEAKTRAAQERARMIARGGLAAFVPRKTPAPQERINFWEELANYPFAVEEMELIKRYQSAPQMTRLREVSLGLLQASRNRHGDKATFESLVQEIRSGHLSKEVLLHFFTMLEDGLKLNETDSQAVTDALLSYLDLTKEGNAARLAGLCGEVGQHERATALYRYSALLASDDPNSFTSLLAQAKETYSGDELMNLGESIFEMTGRHPQDISQLLNLRLEILGPKVAAERSRSLFKDEITANNAAKIGQVVSAVPVFAGSGDHELAAKCLAAALSKSSELVTTIAPSPNQRTTAFRRPARPNARPAARVSRRDLIRMFPSDMSQYPDSDKWLATAAATAIQCKQDEGASSAVTVETLLTIAFRQCENDDKEGAVETLASIKGEWLTEAKQHELLAIDVMRLAGQAEQAHELASEMHTQRRLTHRRFGDLLRDTNKADGLDAATQLFSELAELSLNKDLLAAAGEIAAEADDQALLKQVEELQTARDGAVKEYKLRRSAALQRAMTIQKWRLEDNLKRFSRP